MRKSSIRIKILLSALLPAMCALVLLGILILEQKFDHRQIARGEQYIQTVRQTVSALRETNLQTSKYLLRTLSRTIIQSSQIYSVSFYDTDHHLVLNVGTEPNPAQVYLPLELHTTQTESRLTISAPITDAVNNNHGWIQVNANISNVRSMDDKYLILIICVTLLLLSLTVFLAISRANKISTSLQALQRSVKKFTKGEIAITIPETDMIEFDAFLFRSNLAISSDSRKDRINQLEQPANNLQLNSVTSKRNASPADRERLPYEHLAVLAVDDNQVNLRFVCTLLEDLGIETTSACNGEDALKIASDMCFDLIFMDVQMPGLSGIETMQRIHAIEDQGLKTPIIALSAHALPDQIMQLLNAGMDDYIVKPVSEQQLKEKLDKWTNETISAQASVPVSEKLTVDWEWSLKLANNKPELALELLSILKETLPEDQAAMNSAYTSGDIKLLKHVLHRLRGAVAYCGVPGLRDAIEHFATVLNTDNSTRAQSDLDAVNREIEALITWETGRKHPFAS